MAIDLRPHISIPEDAYQTRDPFASALEALRGGAERGYGMGQMFRKQREKKKQVEEFRQQYPQLAHLANEDNIDLLGIKVAMEEMKQQSRMPRPSGNLNIGMKEKQFHLKRLDSLLNKIDPNKARAGEMGKNQARYNSASRILTLYEQTGGNPTSRQTEEIAVSLNTLMTGGSGTAVQIINSLVPKTLVGNVNGIAEWWTNNPRGSQQQAFARQLAETAHREGNLAAKQIRNAQEAEVRAAESTLRSAIPDEFDQSVSPLLKLNPELSVPAFVNQMNVPKVGEIRKGHRFLGGNPADRNSWVKIR